MRRDLYVNLDLQAWHELCIHFGCYLEPNAMYRSYLDFKNKHWTQVLKYVQDELEE